MTELVAQTQRVWIITSGEPLPMDSSGVRLLRHGMVAAMMAERGWDVTWWTSNFDHTSKVFRFQQPGVQTHTVSSNYRIRLLPSRGYARNVSLARVLDHRDIARAFFEQAQNAALNPSPNVILCSYPTLELAAAATRFGLGHGAPVVLDVRDLWPDIFVDLAPPPLRLLARALLWPYARLGRRALREATALIGITPPILEWACEKAGRLPTSQDQSFALACPEPDAVDTQELARARERWAGRGVDAAQFVVCFFGAMGRQFDFESVVQAARVLERDCPDVKFVLCGQGAALPGLQAEAKGLSNLIVPGWLAQADLLSLMQLSSAGLAPYINEYSFTLSVPNKVIEYLSGGLPVLSCLTGSTRSLLEANACGVPYDEGDSASLVAAIQALRSQPEQRALLAASALALYRASFTAAQVYGGLIDHLSNLAAIAPRQAKATS